jgi:hypothetical protein
MDMARLLEEKYARLHHASPKGDAAAAIRERDLAKVRRLLSVQSNRRNGATFQVLEAWREC